MNNLDFHSSRQKHDFGEMLEKTTGLKPLRHFPVCDNKYNLDFYFDGDLIVEYYEKNHNYTKEKDEERINHCLEWMYQKELEIDCDSRYTLPVIRVKEGEEFEGISKIIKYLSIVGAINIHIDEDSLLDIKRVNKRPISEEEMTALFNKMFA